MTETSLLHDLDAICKVLLMLRAEGSRSRSTISVKIDISFIADLEADPGGAAITEAIIGLAGGLGLNVVAEGVGTRATRFLARRGRHAFRGLRVSEPLPAEAFLQS